jgi:hypothetical protein
MKQNVNHLTFLSFLFALSILIIACGGDDNKKKKSEEELQFEKLKQEWTLSEAKLNGSTANAADLFNKSSVKLIVTGTFAKDAEYNYTINATPEVDASPWPSSGKFKFGSPIATTLIRKTTQDGDRTLTYAITNEGKTLTISIPAYNGENYVNRRVSSTKGDWEFKFTRP